MPDLHDEPDLAGNGSMLDHRDSIGADDSSPPAHHGKASDSDPPKKKRKVNHGLLAAYSSLELVLTDCHSMCLLSSLGKFAALLDAGAHPHRAIHLS
jgi:hypothetical protein